MWIGVLFVVYALYRSRKKWSTYALDEGLCNLFYEQHAFLYTNKEDFFEYTKIQELIFSQKQKFLSSASSIKEKEAFLAQAKEDMVYVKGLIHST